MPTITTTSPQRLRQIIDKIEGLTAPAEIAAYLATLTQSERNDYIAYIQNFPGHVEPAPKPGAKHKAPTRTTLISPPKELKKLKQREILEDYTKWAEGRIGLTEEELVQNYSNTHNLTQEEQINLYNTVTKQRVTPTPTEAPIAPIQKEEEGERLTPEREEEEARAMAREEEEGERLTPEREEEEARAMEKAYKPEPTVPPETIITRIDHPKWWKNGVVGAISLTAPGSQLIIGAPSRGSLYIATIVLTVTDATAITIYFGRAGSSGPIYLGDTEQPKGIVIAMGNSPAPCGSGGLSIGASDIAGVNPSIGGFATGFIE
jgi:hypothetical protein